ncbi:MAG: TIGR01244 family sulfur transferase [Tropicimonas sp.]|uniref:TIGR01244 family sulfur transferase n=1 Tax=Tropicimonas sp. TaxID=2067044 RepID=UPI003A8A5D16
MNIHPLTDGYAVSPQITPEDVPAIAAAGFRTIICNRPDQEVTPGLRAADIRTAAEQAGLDFIELPLMHGVQFNREIARQRETIAASDGPVLAYCASGTRSTIIWMFGAAGTIPVPRLLEMASKAGYPLAAYRQQLEEAARE